MLIPDDARLGRATMRIDRSGHDRKNTVRHMPRVMFADIARQIRQPAREHRRLGIQKQPRRLDHIAGNAYGARFLLMNSAAFVPIGDTGHFAISIMVDLDGHRIRPKLEVIGLLCFADFGI